jgi:catechol 2,3-dioxygenase-like lactoylglutathione lyase family enzyme
MISRMHSASVIVANQDTALDFYVNTLGWKKVHDDPMGPDIRFLTVVPPGGSTELVLAPLEWYGGVNTRQDSGITLVADDIDATYKTLTERGVKFEKPVEVMPWGQKATWFFDIDGNKFFLAEE